MLRFLRVSLVLLAVAVSVTANAEERPAPAPAEAAAVAPSASPPADPVRTDKPSLDDLRDDRPEALESTTGSLLASLVQMLLVLGLVLGLVYVTLHWGLRKLLRISPAATSVVRVHERVSLDAKKTVYLVEAADEYLLLGVGEGEVSFLTRLDAERAKAALARKGEGSKAPALAGKPFWERLAVKPPPKDQGGAQGGPQAAS